MIPSFKLSEHGFSGQISLAFLMNQMLPAEKIKEMFFTKANEDEQQFYKLFKERYPNEICLHLNLITTQLTQQNKNLFKIDSNSW